MLGMFATVLINDTFILNQLVFFAEANVTIRMKLRHVPREILNMNGITCFSGDNDGCFKVNIWW